MNSAPSLRRNLPLFVAFRMLFQSGFNVSQALAAAEKETWGPEAARFFDFIREAKKRGICDYIGRSTNDEE